MASIALSTVACAVISRICGGGAFRGGPDELANQVKAGELRHQVVDEQHVEHAAAEEPLRLTRALDGGDLVAILPERFRQRIPDLRFIVDEENGTGNSHAIAGGCTGSSMRTSVPRLRSL